MQNIKKYSYIILITILFIEIFSFLILFMKPILLDDAKIKKSFLWTIVHHPLYVATNKGVKGYNNPGYAIFSPTNQTTFTSNNTYYGLKTGEIGQVLNSKDNDGKISLEKKPNEVRIMFLGGSSAAGYGATSEENTITAHLEKMLNSNTSDKKNYQVINFGLFGSYSFQNLISVINKISFLDPDVIISLDGYNDIIYSQFLHKCCVNLSNPILNWGAQSYEIFDGIHGINKIKKKKWVLTFTRLLAEKMNKSVYNEENKQFREHIYSVHPEYILSKKILSNYEDSDFNTMNFKINLDFISAWADRNDIKYFAYLQPNRYQFAEKDGLRGLTHNIKGFGVVELEKDELVPKALWESIKFKEFETTTLKTFNAYAKIFDELNLKYSDTTNVYFSDIRKIFLGIKEQLYVDTVHYTDEGNYWIAKRMSQDL